MMWFDLVVVGRSAPARAPTAAASRRCWQAPPRTATAPGCCRCAAPATATAPARGAGPAAAARPTAASSGSTPTRPSRPGWPLVYHVGPLLAGCSRRGLPVRAAQRLLRLDQPPWPRPGEHAVRPRPSGAAGRGRVRRAAGHRRGRSADRGRPADPAQPASGLDRTVWPPVTMLRGGEQATDRPSRLGRHCLGGWGAAPSGVAASCAPTLPTAATRSRWPRARWRWREARPAAAGLAPARAELADPAAFLPALHAYVFATARAGSRSCRPA